MIRSFRLRAWLFSSFGAAALAMGCTSAPKMPSLSDLKPSKPASPVQSVGNPGSADFTTSNSLKNPVKVHLAYALWHEQEGNLVEARNSYERVLHESPKNIEGLLGIARLDIALGRMDDAEKRLAKAQKLAPKNYQVAVALGQYHSARNEWPQALEQMQIARSLAPNDPACAYHLGNVQAKTGDLTSALANFTEAVGAPAAHYNLAYMLHQQGDLAGAEEHLQRAISLKPDLAQAQSLMLAMRQERQSGKQVAQRPRATMPPSIPAPASSVIQPASYTEPAKPSTFAPAPVR